jgi:hypothetical protein
VDRRPGWLVLLSATVWTVGLMASLVGPATHVWRPAAGDRWLWPGPGTVASTVDSTYDVVVLDPFVTGADEVGRLHAAGQAVVCQLRAGVWEFSRPDVDRLDPALVGDSASADARWLDIRRLDALTEPLTDRLILCAGKGFDGVVLTELDGWAHATGFPLSGEDQLRFNTAMVELAQRHGLRAAILATDTTPIPSTVDVTVTRPGSGGAAGSAGTSTTTGS